MEPNSYSPQQATQVGGASSTRGQGAHRPRHNRDTVHVRPHRTHITWLDNATPPTLPPALPLRRSNRLLALYNHNGRWDLRVILAPPRGGQRPFVARGICPKILYEPTNTVGHDVFLPEEGTSLQATPLGPAAAAPRHKWGLTVSLTPTAWLLTVTERTSRPRDPSDIDIRKE